MSYSFVFFAKRQNIITGFVKPSFTAKRCICSLNNSLCFSNQLPTSATYLLYYYAFMQNIPIPVLILNKQQPFFFIRTCTIRECGICVFFSIFNPFSGHWLVFLRICVFFSSVFFSFGVLFLFFCSFVESPKWIVESSSFHSENELNDLSSLTICHCLFSSSSSSSSLWNQSHCEYAGMLRFGLDPKEYILFLFYLKCHCINKPTNTHQFLFVFTEVFYLIAVLLLTSYFIFLWILFHPLFQQTNMGGKNTKSKTWVSYKKV